MKAEHNIEIMTNPSASLCSELFEQQKNVWSMADKDAMPPWKISITPKIGGLLIVAFVKNKPVAHAIFSPAFDTANASRYLYLDMIGVLPEFQGKQLGENIILAAKAFANSKGYSSLQWTYDPLEGANANLYVGKLGASIIAFYPNYYGELSGARHQGSQTDRFLAKLDITQTAKSDKKINHVIGCDEYHEHALIKMLENYQIVAIEFPKDCRLIASRINAETIRSVIRKVFLTLFRRGFYITGFYKKTNANYYIAEKRVSL